MLMKPRRWLGYTISLNDELTAAERVIDLFEQSAIPLSDTVGSSSAVEGRTRSVIVMFGPRVERDRLIEVLDLLREAKQPVHFLLAETESDYRKTILIGSYDLDHKRAAPFTAELDESIRATELDSASLSQLVQANSAITPLTVR